MTLRQKTLKKKIANYLMRELDAGLVYPKFTRKNCDYMADRIIGIANECVQLKPMKSENTGGRK